MPKPKAPTAPELPAPKTPAPAQAPEAANPAPASVNCFPAGTPVAAPDGFRPIETIGPGEPVWSFDFCAGQWIAARVEINQSAVYEGQFVTLRFDDCTTLEVTEDHPFWVVEGDGLAQRPQLKYRDANEDSGLSLPGRWVHSHALRVGDRLYNRTGGLLTIAGLRCCHDRQEVYNLAVVGLPYYAVGQHGILVHNTETGNPINWWGRFKQWWRGGQKQPPTVNPGKTILAPDVPYLVAVKDGRVIAHSADTMLSHAEFVKRFNIPSDAWVGTVIKSPKSGAILGINSRGVMGNSMVAPQEIQEALCRFFH
jgi:hypothetical protein